MALWALYAALPPAAQAAMVPGGLLFYSWEVSDMVPASLAELAARGHAFVALTDAAGALAGLAVLSPTKRVRGATLYAALYVDMAAAEPARGALLALVHHAALDAFDAERWVSTRGLGVGGKRLGPRRANHPGGAGAGSKTWP